MNIFTLLGQRRFSPLFWVQFSSAMNNNLFKSALMVLIAFQNFNSTSLTAPELINMAAGLFILPFVLFSPLAGFLADKYEKSQLIKKFKLLEVCIMILAALAFYVHSLYFLLWVLFLLGIQSTLFGPLKYSILPQHLASTELIAGNALIEMGTFIAILIGTVLGSALIYIPQWGVPLTLGMLLASAFLSYAVSFYVPIAPPNEPHLRFTYQAISNVWTTLQMARQNKMIFTSILATSWFWLYGAFVLAQLPSYVSLVIGANARIFTLFLAIFSIGIGLGSLLCSQLSKQCIRPNLVPLGALGMSVFAVGLFFVSPSARSEHLLTLIEFLGQQTAFPIILCLLGLSVSAGIYTVPLFALMQQRSPSHCLSRVMAANNIWNALFMIMAAVLGIMLLKFHFTIPEMLLLMGGLNLLFNGYIFYREREFINFASQGNTA
jgi:MFS family permease